jgi:hypothetical protein
MSNNKTLNCLNETHKHVRQVQMNLNLFVHDLIDRGQKHDDSKFVDPELAIFAEKTPELAKTEYGSPEYDELLKQVQPAIDNHYAKNRHHPEHWENGVNDMTLLDLLEMLADWKAATQRNKNGNIRTSLDINSKRFNIDSQLKQIMENTVREHFKD